MIYRLAFGIALIATPALAETPTRGIVEIEADEKILTFQIEIADEPGEHARGLMFREELPDSAGMLFLYPQPRHTSFWMKNTKIPLDMLFIDPHGKIIKIVPNTEPFSLKPIPSETRVVGVLEIQGGASERLGVEVGDRARWFEFPVQN